MNAFRLSLMTACLFVLGFDLARDGSLQLRLRHGIEKQQQQLSRIRQDLSSARPRYQARMVSITWRASEMVPDEETISAEMALSFESDGNRWESPLPLTVHLRVEEGYGD